MSTPVVHRRLEGKIAIITGGAAGIGEATVLLFTQHGAKVIIADIADDAGVKLAESLFPLATYIHCDVSKEQDVSAAVDLAMEKHGKLDIMFNNAGTGDFHVKSVADYEMEEFDRVMKVNAKGVMHGIKHAARVMIPTKNGCIISTSSITGILGGICPYAYTASKHAIIGLTKNGAAELGKYGIRVNCVSPAAVATELLINFAGQDDNAEDEAFVNSKAEVEAILDAISKKIANFKGVTLKPEDIADAALYLASEESKYVSGHNLVVDGGFTVVNHNWELHLNIE